MATAKKKLQIIIEARNKAQKAIDQVNDSLSNMRRKAKIAGAAIGAFGVMMGKKAVEMAADYESLLSNINTLYDDGGKSVKKFRKGILEMTKTIPKSADELGASAYDIVSAGITDAGSALDVLKNSAKLAVAGLGDTKGAVNLMTSAINAFGIDARNSTHVADVFFKAVKNGKTTVSDLSQGFGRVAPLAHAMNVSFEELAAMTSAMTTSGLSAADAYVQIRAKLTSLAKPTKEMRGLLDELGIKNVQAEIKSKGFLNVIKEITNAAQGNNEELAKAWRSVEALNGVMMMMGDTGNATKDILNNMKDSTNLLNKAVEKQTNDYKAQYQILKNNLNAELIKAGTKILPTLVNAVRDGIMIMEEWKSWFDTVADAIGTVIYKIDEFIRKMERLQSKINPFRALTNKLGITKEEYGLPGFAEGGIVTRPTIAMVGEKGPEAIIPLRGRNKAAGVTINITGNTFTDEQSFERMIDRVVIGKLKLNNII